MKKVRFEMLEHTADIKFRVYGKKLGEIFENSALAVSDFLARGKKIKSVKRKKILIRDDDLESMLYAFLDELIYLLDAEDFIVSKAKIKIKGLELSGVIYGDDAKNYEGLDHVKAATYSEMYVRKKDKGYEAQFVLDV